MNSILLSPILLWGKALTRLVESVSSPPRLELLFLDLGWEVHIDEELDEWKAQWNRFQATVEALSQALNSLNEALKALEEEEPAALGALWTASNSVIAAIQPWIDRCLATDWETVGHPWTSPVFWTEVVRDLPGTLLCRELESESPILFHFLRLLGIVEAGDGAVTNDALAPFRRPDQKRTVRWTQLSSLVGAPAPALAELYRFQVATEFEHIKLFGRLLDFCAALGWPGRIAAIRSEVIDSDALIPPAHPLLSRAAALELPIATGPDAQGILSDIGLLFMPVPLTSSAEAVGEALCLTGFAAGAIVGPAIKLPGNWTGQLTTRASGTGAIAVVFAPDRVSLNGVDSSLDAVLKARRPAEEYTLLLGGPNSARIEVGELSLEAGARSAQGGEVWATFAAARCGDRSGLRVVLEPFSGSAVSFLKPEPITLELDLALRYSSRTGFSLGADGELRCVVRPRVAVGPLEIQEVMFGLEPTPEHDGIRAVIAVSGGFSLGPVRVHAREIGTQFDFRHSATGAGIAGLDIQTSLKPPSGLGVTISAGAVSGSGFLSFEPERHLYQGSLALDFSGFTFAATGILATELPNGKPGYSLLALINVTFASPIQLGWGFTLNAIGGLLGIHRACHVDNIRAGLQQQQPSLSRIMFPKVPVANTSQLLADLTNYFPITQNRYVFGPMVQLGWGTPTLIRASLALLLELPKPVRLIALGSITAALPNDDEATALIVLKLDVVGVLDFDRKELSLDGSLVRGSRLGPLNLTGQMALRSSWGNNPGFALSIGGFYPAFKPPAGFPSLNRVGLSLASSSALTIKLSGYLAITTSSVQFGARVDIVASMDLACWTLSAEAHAGFDALFEFNPFKMQASIDASVAICVDGDPKMALKVQGALSGPAPWKLTALARGEVCGYEFEISFSKTVKGGTQPPIIPRNPRAELIAALQAASSWSVKNPSGKRDPVMWVMPDLGPDVLVAHPAARLGVRQNLLPLGTPLQCFGSAPLAGASQYDILQAKCGNSIVKADKLKTLTGTFARASYTLLSETEKLSGKAFEEKPAGIQFTDGNLMSGAACDTDFEYEITFIDAVQTPEPTSKPKFRAGLAFLLSLAKQGAKARQSQSNTQSGRFSNPSGMSSAMKQEGTQ